MIPLRTIVPTRTFPAATVSLIALQAALFVAVAVGVPLVDTTSHGHGTPRRLPAILIAMFVHENGLQWLANTACLWLFGESVEDRTGAGRFAIFYMACGATAAMTFRAADEGAAMAFTTSAAVAGVIGGHLSLFPRSRVLLWLPVPSVPRIIEASSLGLVGLWAAAQAMATAVPPPDGMWPAPPSTAAAAGMIVAALTGAILVRGFTRPERMRPDWWHDRG